MSPYCAVVVIWGIEDETSNIVGTKFRPYADKYKVGNESLENWLARSLNPHCDFKIYELDYQSKHIVIFEIDRARTGPVKFQSTAYIRIDSCLQPLMKFPEIERKLWALDPNEDWSAEICEGATLDDLEPEAAAKARAEYKETPPPLQKILTVGIM